jgi:hypothetical protein
MTIAVISSSSSGWLFCGKRPDSLDYPLDQQGCLYVGME